MNVFVVPCWWRSAILLLLLTSSTVGVLVGCSGADGGRRKVTGNISLDGQPLEGGWIYFRPVDQGHSSAGEISAGKFEIASEDGLIAGMYKVAIEYQEPTGRMQKVYTGEQIEERTQIIPPQYNEHTTLTAEIQASGLNQLTFDLTSK